MKKFILSWSAVISAGLVFGEGEAPEVMFRFSENVWAVSGVKLDATIGVNGAMGATYETYSNRCWGVAYSGCIEGADDSACTDITVQNYFKTRNCETGDMVMIVNPAGYYEAYELSAEGKWTAVTTVERKQGGQKVAKATDPATRTLPRGTGYWIVRKNVAHPAYVAGQYTTASAETPIPKRTSPSLPSWTLVCPPFANPDAAYKCSQEGKISDCYDGGSRVDINELFKGYKAEDLKGDLIAVPQGNTGAMLTLTYGDDGKWGYVVTETAKTSGSGRRGPATQRRVTENIKVPFFWYQRFKDKSLTITWPSVNAGTATNEQNEGGTEE